MKKIRISVLLFSFVMLFSGCGNNTGANSAITPESITSKNETNTTSQTASNIAITSNDTTQTTYEIVDNNMDPWFGEEINLDGGDTGTNSSDDYYDSIDYYSLYDPINNRTNFIPNDGVIIGADDSSVYLVFGDPNWMDPYFYYKLPNAVRYLYSSNVFSLKNNIFYYTSSSSTETLRCGLSRYDRNTGNAYVVVPANDDMPYSEGLLGRSSFMLSNDCKIYGIIPSYKKQPMQSDDGKMSVEIIYNWNLIKVNDDYNGYEIIKVLEPEYDYVLCGIYDGNIYLEKYTMKKLESESRLYGSSYSGGDFLGLYTYNINNEKETKILDTAPCRNGGSSIYGFRVLEYQGKCALAYAGWDELSRLFIKIEDNNWKELYSSANQFWFGYSNVQYTNNKFYIPLTDYSNSPPETMFFSADTTGSEYIGVGENNSVVIENNITGRTQYVNSQGGLKDFE